MPIKFRTIFLPVAAVFLIDRQNVGNVDVFYVARFARGLIFCRDVFGELAFCCRNLARSAACGDMLVAIEDDPACPPDVVAVAPGRPEPESDAFLTTRHSCLIRSMLASVV